MILPYREGWQAAQSADQPPNSPDLNLIERPRDASERDRSGPVSAGGFNAVADQSIQVYYESTCMVWYSITGKSKTQIRSEV